MKPAHGRNVLYRHGDDTLPATITRINDDGTLSLVVFGCDDTHPAALFKNVSESGGDKHDAGTYRWPTIEHAPATKKR